MSIKELKQAFEADLDSKIHEKKTLCFTGIDGYTVYNCSIPFRWQGKTYIYGRVERLEEWATSWVRLFVETGPDEFALVQGHMIYPLEDPYIAQIQGELVLGGTHVRKRTGEIDAFYGYFYRGADIDTLSYFTTGPENMKDIRLVDLENGKMGVFSRPRSEEILRQYGSHAMIGFTIIDSLSELTAEVIAAAAPIEGVFDRGEWGGCNQAYLLQNGNIGIIGHQSYMEPTDNPDLTLAVYVNTAFEFNPETKAATHNKVIGTRSCYPAGQPKLPELQDCTFTSGIVMRDDGRADLYAGIGDTAEGRIVIDYPFSSPIK